MSELRLKGIADPDDVYHAILEPNGQLSVITKAASSPVTARDVSLKVEEQGLSHAVIVDGHIKPDSLEILRLTPERVEHILRSRRAKISDVFLMTVNDAGEVKLTYKEERKRKK